MCLPGFLGRFIDSLAAEAEALILFLHEADATEAVTADYAVEAGNVSWVNLGAKTPAWHRSLFHQFILRQLSRNPVEIDLLLLRSPSPLAPYFSEIDWLRDRIAYMVVSDYGTGAEFVPRIGLRNRLVRLYTHWNDRVFKRRLEGQLVIANSREIYRALRCRTDNLHEAKTTTLSTDDFFAREDTCQGGTIRLLFTGRIVMAKGLRELVQAAVELIRGGMSIEVHFVGWEDKAERPVETALRELAGKLGIREALYFHGFKRAGAEMNAMYRMADLYVLPSYYEGFPRTIWEAMANSLPVIATKVGAISDFLRDGDDALLIPSRSVDALVSGIRQLARDAALRKRLIRGGMDLARENTLDIQAKKLVGILRDHLAKQEWNEYCFTVR